MGNLAGGGKVRQRRKGGLAQRGEVLHFEKSLVSGQRRSIVSKEGHAPSKIAETASEDSSSGFSIAVRSRARRCATRASWGRPKERETRFREKGLGEEREEGGEESVSTRVVEEPEEMRGQFWDVRKGAKGDEDIPLLPASEAEGDVGTSSSSAIFETCSPSPHVRSVTSPSTSSLLSTAYSIPTSSATCSAFLTSNPAEPRDQLPPSNDGAVKPSGTYQTHHTP